MSGKVESYKFEAEINQLMSLIVNAFYSNKDVFLRELISNASDAIDKIKYKSLTEGKEVLGDEPEFQIKIRADKENNQLIIYDTGIGMTHEDLIKNLGTVARSGTKLFMETLRENKTDINSIGQFGVGFYSAFLVGDKVSVVSKNNNDRCYMWESTAGENFTVTEVDDPELKRGTKIIVHVKEDAKEYLNEDTLLKIINTHSNYITYPIYFQKTKSREVEVEEEKVEEKVEEKKEDVTEEAPKVEEVEEEKEDKEENKEEKKEKKEKKKVTETYYEYEQVNNDKPVWVLPPKEVTKEEYEKFYKSFSNDYQEYQYVSHFRVEGNHEFTCLLYIPKNKPFDMFQQEKKKQNNIKLHVKRVFITDECGDKLIPEYLSFVKGVVDSNDLPLNVSREMLQQNKVLDIIKKQIVKKVLDLLEESAKEEPEKYVKFYEQFQKYIKLGVHDDDKNRDKLKKLLRFFSANHKDKAISFDDYVKEMKEGQSDIYYITGESVKSVEDSPYIEGLKSKGYDVLFLTDPIDEYVTQHLKEFDSKKFVDVSREGLDLQNNKEEKEKIEKEYEPLCKHIKEILGDNVEKVITSTKLTKTPCVISASQFGYSANMERILKSQALRDPEMLQYMKSKKVLELNPNSKLIQKLLEKFNEDKHAKSVKDLVWLFFESSMISAGFSLDKPAMLSKRIFNIASLALSVDELEDVEDVGKVDENANFPDMPNLENLNDDANDDTNDDTNNASNMEQLD